MTSTNQQALPRAGTEHYVALCVVSLAFIFVVQLQAGLLLANILGVLVGAAALLYHLRLGPMMLVVFVAGAQLTLQARAGRLEATMDLYDVLLCAAVMGYVAGHYRLQSIWHSLLPADSRLRVGPPRARWFSKQGPRLQEKRPGSQITPQEIASLVITLPVWAVLAQVARALLPEHWYALGLPGPLVQILVVLWLLAVAFLVVMSFLNVWKHQHHDAATAQLYLQDLLWRETRGEQRRVNRWLSWWLRRRQQRNTETSPRHSG